MPDFSSDGKYELILSQMIESCDEKCKTDPKTNLPRISPTV